MITDVRSNITNIGPLNTQIAKRLALIKFEPNSLNKLSGGYDRQSLPYCSAFEVTSIFIIPDEHTSDNTFPSIFLLK